MKKTNRILTTAFLAALIFAGQVLAAGQLSTVTVSENGSVFVKTGSPSEFRSFWTGQAGSFKLTIDLPGVTVPKTAKLLGNVSSARGLKGIRFSQFKAEPPVARLVIEAAERLSYTWSTTPEGVEIRFNLPMMVPMTSDASPTSSPTESATETGTPGASKTGTDSGTQTKVTSTGLTTNAPLPVGGIKVGSATLAPKPAAAATGTGKNSVSTPAAQSTSAKPAETSKSSTPTTGAVTAPKTDTPSTTATVPAVSTPAPTTSGTSNATAAPGTTAGGPKTPKSVAKVTIPSGTAATTGTDSVMATKKTDTASTADKTSTPAPTSTGTPATVPNPTTTSGVPGKTGTAVTPKSTTPAASGPASGPTTASTPASGTSGTAVKPSSPAPTPSQTVPMGPMPVSGPAATAPGAAKASTPSGTATTPPASGTAAGKTAAPSTPAKTGTTTAAPVATTAGKPATGTLTPASTAKPAETGKGTPATTVATVPPAKGTAVPTAAVKPESTQAVNPDKFKAELKKALGKIEPPAKPEDSKISKTGKTETAPVEKLSENSFQEQLKKALDPALSLTDSGETADIDDIDTELPADDEEAYDTTFAYPGGTFMQVSPSRKVIRYHSEGRRDPFSPLVGKDRYSGSKKRRAVPAAEQLRLVGIMRSLAGNKALLEDGEGNGYILSPGERVRNGYLVSVSESKVLFQVTEYGWTKTVAMELANLE